MNGEIVKAPAKILRFLGLIVVFVFIFFLFWYLGGELGIPPNIAAGLFIGVIVGSFFNIPLFKTKNQQLISLNVGGAVIPIGISIYLIAIHIEMILYFLIGMIVLGLVCFSVAKVDKERGILTPFYVPPAGAIALGVLLPSDSVATVFVVGCFGVLIGADVMNLDAIYEIDYPIIAIGGAGSFDGILVTAMAAILVSLFL